MLGLCHHQDRLDGSQNQLSTAVGGHSVGAKCRRRFAGVAPRHIGHDAHDAGVGHICEDDWFAGLGAGGGPTLHSWLGAQARSLDGALADSEQQKNVSANRIP